MGTASTTKQLLKKLTSCVYVFSGGIGLFSAYNIYNENEKFYEAIVLPAVHKLNPETAHNLGVITSKYKLLPKTKYVDGNSLATEVWGLKFKNPIGMAAGFDKQGEAVEGLHDIGFGFVEVGSVTPQPQPGNSKPRVFRLTENQAIINRYGFNSDGHDEVYKRLESLKQNKTFNGVLGINLGKNKESSDPVDDYVKGIKLFGEIADYLVINISSPNTPGLRDWQRKEQLEELLRQVVAARNSLPGTHKPPLLVKLAPDLTANEKKDIAQVLTKPECAVDGLVISNTTVGRDGLTGPYKQESGGLSGAPLSGASTELIAEMYSATKGKIPIIGVGGVFSGEDAYNKILAGASLIQLYTAFIYHGPPRVTRIKKELDDLLQKDGFKSVSEAVGKGVK
ncbi:dihydroorotate dehydrogenase (quinone), mitochondrial-like [Macrosteles quadrilineatus]|uniref:dihydroorotate dehydrogenase (quinone), mitochondrial-like n=1 Tax=Macrosteles quadrilineatus TaxID=74068 RepID=UPI0023E1D5C5|nr:dihydroorotate dehydrogenase (quinone), mitochondrial-like [Macrosteles quadrilineatus]